MRSAIREVASIAGAEIPGSESYAKDIARDAIRAQRKTGVPASVLIGLTGQESAYGTNTGPSSAGAMGRAQFIPSTRADFISTFGIDPWKQKKGQDILGAALHLEEYGATPFSQDPTAALNSYSGGYGDAAYNSPVLGRAQRFHKTGIDRFADKGGKIPSDSGSGGPSVKRVLKHVAFSESPEEIASEQGAPWKSTIRGMNDPLRRGLIRLSRQTGIDPVINEGYRTEDRATDFPSGTGSQHHQGNAADIDNNAAYTAAMLARAGLNNTAVAGEPWHFQPNELGSATSYSPSGRSGGFLGGITSAPAPTSSSFSGTGSVGSSVAQGIQDAVRTRRGANASALKTLPFSASAPRPEIGWDDEEEEIDPLTGLPIEKRYRPRRRRG